MALHMWVAFIRKSGFEFHADNETASRSRGYGVRRAFGTQDWSDQYDGFVVYRYLVPTSAVY